MTDSTICAYSLVKTTKASYGFGPCTTKESRAVCWNEDGVAACGVHSVALTRGLKPE